MSYLLGWTLLPSCQFFQEAAGIIQQKFRMSYLFLIKLFYFCCDGHYSLLATLVKNQQEMSRTSRNHPAKVQDVISVSDQTFLSLLGWTLLPSRQSCQEPAGIILQIFRMSCLFLIKVLGWTLLPSRQSCQEPAGIILQIFRMSCLFLIKVLGWTLLPSPQLFQEAAKASSKSAGCHI